MKRYDIENYVSIEVFNGGWVKYYPEVEKLEEQNKVMLEALKEVVKTQKLNHGYATNLHMIMGDLVKNYKIIIEKIVGER